jgi:hypothetical protein
LAAEWPRDGVALPPAERTLTRWSSKCKWIELAAAHDERVAQRAVAKIETAQARTIADLAVQSIQAADRGFDAALKLEPQSFGEAINGAVAAGKFASLLTGGATERTESAVRRLSIDIKAGLAKVRAASMIDADPASKTDTKH